MKQPKPHYYFIKTSLKIISHIGSGINTRFRPVKATNGYVNGNDIVKIQTVFVKPLKDNTHSVALTSEGGFAQDDDNLLLSSMEIGPFPKDPFFQEANVTIEADFQIDVFNKDGYQWPIGNERNRTDSPVTLSFQSDDLEGHKVIEYETYVKHIYYWNSEETGNVYPLDVYSPFAHPAENDPYFVDLDFYKLPEDSTHENLWKTKYNDGDSCWVNSPEWVIQWKNYDPNYTGLGNTNDPDKGFYSGIDLYWRITANKNEAADSIISPIKTLDSGFQSYVDTLHNGTVYNEGLGVDGDHGYVKLNLNKLHPNSSFKGNGYLHLVMAVKNKYSQEILWKSDIKTYTIMYDSVTMADELDNTQGIGGKDQAIIKFNSPFGDLTPDSPVLIEYQQLTPASDDVIEIKGMTDEFTVNTLGNQNTEYKVTVKHMNQDNIDTISNTTGSFMTRPIAGEPNINYVPYFDGDDLLFNVTVTANVANNDNQADLTYAFDMKSISEAVTYETDEIDFDTQSSITYQALTEADVENKRFTSLIQNSAGVRDWYSVTTGVNTIQGKDGFQSASDNTPIEVTIPAEFSNRIVKEFSINKLTYGQTSFGNSNIINRTYPVDRQVESIYIETQDYIPMEFPGPRSDYIQFFLVVGNTKVPITPKGKPGDAPAIYHINSTIPSQMRIYLHQQKEGFIECPEGFSEITIEVVINGHADYDTLTPIVFNWKVTALV